MSTHADPSAESPAAAAPEQPSFEQSLDRKLGGGGGSALPAPVAEAASSAYGTDMSSVRVHEDADSAAMADSQGFRAFSYGGDVFAKPGAVDTSTEDGSFVMMHELAHVAQSGGQREAGVQGKVEIGSSSDALEVDADRGAEAALGGSTYQVQSAPLVVRGFGATARRDEHGNRNRGDYVHENQTMNAAESAGFNDRDQNMMYSGNWQRDMNQLLIPTLRTKILNAEPLVFAAMDLIHTLHFGYPIGGSEEQMAGGPGGAAPGGRAEFGTYDPVEHIDNPGGLTGANVNQQNGGAEGADVAGTTLARDGSPNANAGRNNQAYAEVDARYSEQYQRALAAGRTIENPTETNDAFKVDDSGIPIYMQTSRHQLIQRLHQGVDLAGTGDATQRQGNYDRALRYAGEALHIMQDYYAHSNFCEVGLNMLMDERFTASGGVAQQGAEGTVSFVDSLGLAQINPALQAPGASIHHLNSYVHARGADGSSNNDQNMRTRGGREVMATGTFTLEDTAHSLKEKVGLALRTMNPFTGPESEAPSEKVLRLIGWFETNPDYFPFDAAQVGASAGGMLDAVMPAIEAMGSAGSAVMSAHGTVSAAMDRGWGNVQGLWHRAWGDGAAATAAENRGQAASAHTLEQSQQRQATITRLTAALGTVRDTLVGGGSLSALYRWSVDAGNHVKLAEIARLLPIVGDRAAELVDRKVKEAKKWIKERLAVAWNVAANRFTTEFNSAVALALGSSEVSDKTGAQTMTQPTHTDIAKDFDPEQQGTEDNFSVIEEVGEFLGRVGGWRNAGTRVLGIAQRRFNDVMSRRTGVVEGLRGAAAEVAAEAQVSQGEEHGHNHQHRHAGAWLAPLASSLATQSSEAILQIYRPALQARMAGGDAGNAKSQLTSTVHAWFAHPADCRGLWQGHFMQVLSGDSVDARAIKRELATRMALPPSEQTTNDEHTTGGEDRHHDHDDGDHDHGEHREWQPGTAEQQAEQDREDAEHSWNLPHL